MQNKTLKCLLGLLAVACFSTTALPGCASGEIDGTPDSNNSADTDVMADAGTDGDSQSDGGDTEEDTFVPPPEPVQTLAPSGGGATLDTTNHSFRLIVAPRGGARTLETSNHRIRLGAGAAQHGQER
ncbi:MAG: hypothetical protein ACQEVA_17195 [Myxococcota bacterium]